MTYLDNLKQIWPQWELGELIDKGSYAKVYKAYKEDHGINTSAAVKIIQIPFSSTHTAELQNSGMDQSSICNYYNDLIQNLTSEIKIMDKLHDCPYIVNLQDFYIDKTPNVPSWRIYIRMELLTNLEKYIQREGTLSVGEVVKLGIDICQALIYCEKNKIIHRDIKPSNIFINKDGLFKLGDFGISKQLESLKNTETCQGTPYYMAPEIYRGEKYNNTVDIYSLGITLYRLLNNYCFPFITSPSDISYDTNEKALNKRLSGSCELPPPINADENLSKIILKACQFKATDRYQTASVLMHDLIKWQIKYGNDTVDNNEKTISLFNNTVNRTNATPEKFAVDEDSPMSHIPTAKSSSTDSIPTESQGKKTKRRKFKKLTVLLLILVLLFFASQILHKTIFNKDYQSTYNDNGEEVSRTYFADNGTKERVVHLDSDKHIISADYYNNDDKVYSYEYNKDGQRILETNYKHDGSITDYTEFNYNKDGSILGKVYLANKTLTQINVYDKNFYILNSTLYDSNGLMKEYVEYDSNEKKLSSISYNSQEMIDSYSYYEYSSDGLLITEKVLGPDEKPLHQIEYTYNASGHLFTKTYYSSDQIKFYQQEFNSSGDILYEYYYLLDGSIDYHYEYSYNSDGIKLQSIYYNSDNIKEYVNEFDINGNKLYQYIYSENNTMTDYYGYNYDSNNLLTYVNHYFSDGTLENYYTVSYNSAGQELYHSYYTTEDVLMYYYKYSYNDNDQVIYEEKYNEYDTLLNYYEYLYDVHGKLIDTNFHEVS